MKGSRLSSGFTLLELLIVIAIIGVLAAVLIPSILGARQSARDRAAQAYAQAVYKIATAYLSKNVEASADDVVQPCGSGVVYTIGDNPYDFYVGDPGGSVVRCEVRAFEGSFGFAVEAESPTGTIYMYPLTVD